MNYPYLIPGAQGDPASFVANTSLTLGSLDKPLDARTLVTVSYASVVPADTVESYSFRVKPGGEPQLWVSETALDTTNTILTFFISGGITGKAYDIIISAELASGGIRSDSLTVNVLGDGCGCMAIPWPTYPLGNAVSGDGAITINTAPRFFVSATTPIGANVLDRWYNSTTGNIYDFVTNGLTSWWEESTLGGGGGYGAQVIKMQPIVPDGVTTSFTLVASDSSEVDVLGANTLLVSVDGVWQEPGIQYGATGTLISFLQPPSHDSIIFMLWLSPPPDTPPAPLREG